MMEEMREYLSDFFASQLKRWDLAAENYAGLSKVVSREIEMDGFRIQIQFNPGRIRSSAANVDVQAISNRACFLCPASLPPEQTPMSYLSRYVILLNPYPIFPRHFTIPSVHHTGQLISGRIRDLLQMARDMQDFVLFYNGPRCGASAPDHFHFQAGLKGLLPVENEFTDFPGKRAIFKDGENTVYDMEHYLRKTLVLESPDAEWIATEFEFLMSLLHQEQPLEAEPMVNILTVYDGGYWRLFVFPRKGHRPSQYFEEGDRKILISPGTVDFGGLLIIPREEDFHKLSRELISDMFSQLTFPDERWGAIVDAIHSKKT